MRRLAVQAVLVVGVALTLLINGSAIRATVTPITQPSPMIGGHSNEDSGDPDPASWVSASADGGGTTAFSLWGTLQAEWPNQSVYSWKFVEDGATYDGTIS